MASNFLAGPTSKGFSGVEINQLPILLFLARNIRSTIIAFSHACSEDEERLVKQENLHDAGMVSIDGSSYSEHELAE